jgi:hypothetical protein
MCSAVLLENLVSERNKVFSTCPARMQTNTELEVLNSIVVLDPVLVMNGLMRSQWPAKVICHDQTMNELALTIPVDVLPDVAFRVVVRLPRANELFCRSPTLEATPVDVAKTMTGDIRVTVPD